MSSSVTSPAIEVERDFGPRFYGSRGLTLVSGSGARLRDVEGREYIDCGSMMGVASTGHAHPRVVSAVQEQAARLAACFGSFANDRRSELFLSLARIIPWGQRFFLCNSGTEAVEAAIKVACARTGRHGLVHLQGSFHGRTLGALALGSRRQHKQPVSGLVPETRAVPAGDSAALDRALDGSVAALVLEPVLGEGGVHPLDDDFLREAARLCRSRGVLLVIDEVQTGCGRTGRWFAHERAGVVPDLLCLAKGLASGLPIGCLVMGEAAGDPDQGLHGSTFGGNPLAAAAAQATLEVIEEEGLVERAARLGEEALARLRPLVGARVRAVRGRGLMIGVETRARALPVVRALQEQGVIALTAGGNVVRLLPPLVIEDADWSLALDRLTEALS